MHDDAGLNGVQPATWSSLMVSDGHLVPLDLMFQTQHLAVAQLKYLRLQSTFTCTGCLKELLEQYTVSLIFFAILCVVSSNVLMFVVKVKNRILSDSILEYFGSNWKPSRMNVHVVVLPLEAVLVDACQLGTAVGEKISAGLSKKHP